MLVACRSIASRASSGVHPFAVVLDANQLLAAELDGDGDAARAGVDRVLDQLLDDGRRALDDLAGGNLVGEVRRQAVNLAHGSDPAALRPEAPASIAAGDRRP